MLQLRPRTVARMARGTSYVRRIVVPVPRLGEIPILFRHRHSGINPQHARVMYHPTRRQQTMSSRCRLVAARRVVWVACRGVAGALRRRLLYVRAAGTLTLAGQIHRGGCDKMPEIMV